MSVINTKPMSNDLHGYRPFWFEGRVFRAPKDHTHVAIDSDGEIHTFTEVPKLVQYNPDTYPGYWTPTAGVGAYVGLCELTEPDEWMLSASVIDWGKGHDS